MVWIGYLGCDLVSNTHTDGCPNAQSFTRIPGRTRKEADRKRERAVEDGHLGVATNTLVDVDTRRHDQTWIETPHPTAAPTRLLRLRVECGISHDGWKP